MKPFSYYVYLVLGTFAGFCMGINSGHSLLWALMGFIGSVYILTFNPNYVTASKKNTYAKSRIKQLIDLG